MAAKKQLEGLQFTQTTFSEAVPEGEPYLLVKYRGLEDFELGGIIWHTDQVRKMAEAVGQKLVANDLFVAVAIPDPAA